MQPLTIQQLFVGELIPALCRTLAHSLWQGLLLSIIAAIVLVATRRRSSALRYNLLTGIYFFFIAGTVTTFFIQLSGSTDASHLTNAVTIDQMGKNVLPATFSHTQDTATLTSMIVAFIDRYSNIIVLTWFVVFLFKAIRLTTGLYHIQGIKRAQTCDAGEYWNEHLRILSDRIGLSKPVRLLQSGIATVPVVLGYFKPVILFPAALLASLPATEVEAVLLHELAHVRRRDYLMNLLQQIVEVFFFFNPAVLWISSLIRTERENCCDDIVLDQTGNNKINYINALIAFQEYRIALPQYTPALMGRKDHLLHRVKRIIYNNNKTLNAMEKIFLTSGIIVAGLLAVAFSPDKNTKRPQTIAIASARLMTVKANSFAVAQKDTVPIPLSKLAPVPSNINTIVDGKRYDLQLTNEIVTALSIDGQKIDDSKIADYKTTTDAIIKQAKENLSRERLLSEKALLEASLAKTDAEESKALAEKMQKLSELSKVNDDNSLRLLQKLKEDNAQQSKVKELQELKLLGRLKEDNAQQFKIKEQQTLELLGQLKEELKTKDSKSSLETQQLLEKLKLKQSALDATLNKALAEKLQSLSLVDAKNQLRLAQVESELSVKDANLSLADAEISKKLNAELRAAELSMKKDKQLSLNAQTNSNQIINDLIREKLIKDKKNVSFSLNKDGLIVNGVKQPDAVFQKFKEKYVKTEDWNFNYNNKE